MNHDAATEALPDIEPGDQPRLRPRGSNQMGMRQFNERVVLQALRVHGSLAKADIARLTGLTAQTIGLITARLDEDQLLRREAPVRGRVGQPSVPLGLHPDGAFAIGILFAGHEGLLIGARRGSPLVVGYGDGEMYLGSDALAVGPFTQKISYLEEGDYVAVTKAGAQMFDVAGKPVERAAPVYSSMWRDHNVFNMNRVPAITTGFKQAHIVA